MMSSFNKSRKIAILGMLISLSLILSYVESLIPFYFGVPGMKLGLANLVVLTSLYLLGAREAFVISILRVLVAGFLFGNGFSIVYSLAGAVLSFVIMCLLKKLTKMDVLLVSVFGGISHNLGQIIVAIIVVENYNLMFYFPVLLIAGSVCGLIIGILVKEVCKRLNDFVHQRYSNGN